MADDVQVAFGATTSGFDAGVDHVRARTEGLHSDTEDLSEQFKKIGEFIAEAFAVHELDEFIEHFANLGTKVEQMQVQFNMNAEQVQEWAFVMRSSGGDADGMRMSLVRLQSNMETALQSAGKQRDGFRALGVDMQFLREHFGDTNAVMLRMADGFAVAQAKGAGVPALISTMGRGAAALAPAFAEGADSIEKLFDKARQTGDVFDEQLIKAFHETHSNLVELDASFEGFGGTIFSIFKPAIDDAIKSMTDFVKADNDAVKDGIFDQYLKDIASHVELLIGDLKMLIEWFKLVVKESADVGGFVVANMSPFSAAWNAMNGSMSKNWTEMVTNMKADFLKFAEDAKQIAVQTGGVMNQILHPMGLPGPLPVPSPFDKPNAGAGGGIVDKGAMQERIQLEQDRLKATLEFNTLELQGEKNKLDEEIAAGQINNQKKYALLQDYAAQTYLMQADEINAELQTNGLSLLQKQQLMEKKLQLDQKYKNDVAKIHAQELADERKPYDQFFATINNGFKQMVTGILQGTQTWRQAMGNLFSNLLASFAGMVEEMAAKWIENQILMAVFGKSEATGIISDHAAEGAAAAYASTAAIPIIGPLLAPAAAATAFGAIMAFNAIPSFDVGTDYVPKTGLALIHKGERIIPADQNAALSKGGASGGDHYHITIHAVDTQSFSDALQRNSRTMMKMINSAARNFNPNVPAWKAA